MAMAAHPLGSGRVASFPTGNSASGSVGLSLEASLGPQLEAGVLFGLHNVRLEEWEPLWVLDLEVGSLFGVGWLSDFQLDSLGPRLSARPRIGPPHTGYEPKNLAENEYLITSTYDSAESIAKSVWTMSKFVLCWHHQCTCRRASLSLCNRKLGVKFISSSEECGETSCVVFKPKEVDSRCIVRQRRFVLRTSTGSGRQRTLIQILSS